MKPTLVVVPALAATLALTAGCELLELATAERPTNQQAEAIGDIFGHVATIGDVIGDPANASDDDVLALFDVAPYVQLVAPSDAAARVAARVVSRAGLTDDGCVVVEGDTATFDCAVPAVAGADCAAAPEQCCQVTGGGSKSGDTYQGSMDVTGAPCGDVSLAAEFTLSDTSGSGTVSVDGGEANPFTVDLILDGITLCPNGAPGGGTLSVTATGDFDGQTVKDTVTIEFRQESGECFGVIAE